jgi:hypothetical protein
LIHPAHGPWWALRAAYLVDVDVQPTPEIVAPCLGCAAPCVANEPRPIPLDRSTAEMRRRCPIGVASRYDDEQIAYHYAR